MNTESLYSSTDAFDAAVLANRPPSTQPASSRPEAVTDFDLSVVVPAMNEEDSVARLHGRVVEVCRSCDKSVEVIFIDDGSTDATWEKMSGLAGLVSSSVPASRTLAIRLRRNFGKAAALAAGFAVARGRVVLTMDADLQDDPDEIPRFLDAIGQGHDVVSGWKRVRHDPWHKVLPSRVFNAMVSGLTGVRLHDHNCGFKAYRREVLAEVDLYGERHRFIPVLASARGWRVGEIEVLHHPRQHGHSKYGWSRIGKGFLDLMSVYLLTGYGRRPLHLIGSAGLACFAAGSLGMLYLSAMWVITRVSGGEPLHLHATAIFYYCILAVLLGAQCVLAGLIAELIVSVSAARDRSLRQIQIQSNVGGGASVLPMQHVTYSVSQVVGFDDPRGTHS
ncbi:glycosyltransferase family 2 protein [Neorhodopirellula pilleata]|uniref:Undecaprenyl-phosphate 4-deoxy-4-formamido-L-arabinose transferase n=1 Tax=Neorhodopirellula pilleata TaxID=2714738 RepID=A0A5C5ZR54_9BACT|nr:glycosyltransferase family 2 protein [Neorhodopirellula pilleata]TWT89387.1 Undecaprenyl-phosphate 4-deoxy-4-formamido-L-arabinose transferase [Neorhodopirellula pilleata]